MFSRDGSHGKTGHPFSELRVYVPGKKQSECSNVKISLPHTWALVARGLVTSSVGIVHEHELVQCHINDWSYLFLVLHERFNVVQRG